MSKGPALLNVSSTHVVDKMAELAAPILTHLPEQYKGLAEGHRRVILLRGLGLSITQVAQVTKYSTDSVCRISAQYKEAIREIALHRDLAIVTVLDQSIGIADILSLPVRQRCFGVALGPLVFIKKDGRRTHEREIARGDGVAHQAMIFPLGVVTAIVLFGFDGPVSPHQIQ